jgi:hypothetical protein
MTGDFLVAHKGQACHGVSLTKPEHSQSFDAGHDRAQGSRTRDYVKWYTSLPATTIEGIFLIEGPAIAKTAMSSGTLCGVNQDPPKPTSPKLE